RRAPPPQRLAAAAEPFASIERADVSPVRAGVGEAKVVLLGEATHGTAEFYRMRARITQALIERKGFRIVAVEADWPDAGRIDHYVRHRETRPAEWKAFARFPEWMWRNTEVGEFVEWLRRHNASLPYEERAAFHGL